MTDFKTFKTSNYLLAKEIQEKLDNCHLVETIEPLDQTLEKHSISNSIDSDRAMTSFYTLFYQSKDERLFNQIIDEFERMYSV